MFFDLSAVIQPDYSGHSTPQGHGEGQAPLALVAGNGRFNRRFWEDQIFDRLVTACANSTGITYSELTQ